MTLISAIIASCSNNDSYKINGKVDKSSDGDKVYLIEWVDNDIDTIAVAEINGQKFQIKGQADQPKLCFLVYQNEEYDASSEIVLENGNISVELGDKSTISGTKENEILNQFKKDAEVIQDDISEIYNDIAGCSNASMYQELVEKYNEKAKEMEDLTKKFVNDNLDKVAGLYVLEQIASSMEEDELSNFVSRIPKSMENNVQAKKIKELYDAISSTMPGKPIKDFTMTDPQGKEYNFAKLVTEKQLTLVDFWASWCGPCMREVPNMKELAKEYAGKDFQIVGISLDSDEKAWNDAIVNKELDWLQLSDLHQWSNEAARLYNVRSIPCLMLVNKDGKIVSKGLSFEETKEIIEKQLNNK